MATAVMATNKKYRAILLFSLPRMIAPVNIFRFG
jgi:hypothetical protein